VGKKEESPLSHVGRAFGNGTKKKTRTTLSPMNRKGRGGNHPVSGGEGV